MYFSISASHCFTVRLSCHMMAFCSGFPSFPMGISEDRWDVTVIACGSSAPAFKSPEIPFRHMTAASSHDWGSCSTYPGWGKSE